MTPSQKIKWAIVACFSRWNKSDPPEYPCEDIDQIYDEAVDNSPDMMLGAANEVRCSGIETGLQSPPSGYYETKELAKRMPDGTWVGWTYRYGGGKHSNPEEIPWIFYAYDVSCHEEDKVVTVRTFGRVKG